jgi:hypothetical protein
MHLPTKVNGNTKNESFFFKNGVKEKAEGEKQNKTIQ